MSIEPYPTKLTEIVDEFYDPPELPIPCPEHHGKFLCYMFRDPSVYEHHLRLSEYPEDRYTNSAHLDKDGMCYICNERHAFP